jgi:hypothetical protein
MEAEKQLITKYKDAVEIEADKKKEREKEIGKRYTPIDTPYIKVRPRDYWDIKPAHYDIKLDSNARKAKRDDQEQLKHVALSPNLVSKSDDYNYSD